MRKRFTKIICVIVAVIVAAGIWLFAGCSNFYSGNKLSGDTSGDVKSNGGFVVEKGDYIYFINGSQTYTADNTFGTPVRGSIMRISAQDFSERNYSSVETVVPLIAYSGNSNAGIFIYGDRVYYATPSTKKNSDGEVLNSTLDFKSTKLDGTETLKTEYLNLDTNSTEYRYVYVEETDTVYLLYIATSETLFGETTGVTNLHSLNTATGEDVILAYNVASVIFDSADKTNPRVYYTMNVTDYAAGTDYGYNQVYTVRADETEANEYDFSAVPGWVDESDVDEGESYNVYINCGDLVFDGIGKTDGLGNIDGTGDEATVFNYDPTGAVRNNLSYYYSISSYQNGTLFYTRTTTNNSIAYLFMQSESAYFAADGTFSASWNAVTQNPDREMRTLTDGSSASGYTYLFDVDGKFEGVLAAESAGGITINKAIEENGAVKLGSKISSADDASYFYILRTGSATLLFVDGDYLYYSLSGGNGYTIYRVNYTGSCDDYEGMPVDDDVDEYNGVRILDLDAASDWYLPELVQGQIVYASEANDMTNTNYVMVCDLRVDGTNEMMTNAQIAAYNDEFTAISDRISDYGDTENYPTATYANLPNALRFAYVTGDIDYIRELATLCNEAALEENEDADPVYSDATLQIYADFLAAEGDWEEYAQKSRMINGEEIFANRRDYYYTVLGRMSDDEAESWFDGLKSSYLQSEPEPDPTWWESLSTTARNWFIAGVTIGGAIVIAGIVVLTVLLVRRRNKNTPEQRVRRIKVDTTDDKNIDVYATDEPARPEDGQN